MNGTLLKFADRAAAESALGAPLPENIGLNVGGLNAESVRVITQESVWNTAAFPQTLTSPETLAPGWFCWFVGPLPPALAQAASDAAAAQAGAVRVEPVVAQ